MAQFIINEDGLITEAAANEQAAWYVSKCPEVEPIDFEAHLMLMYAYNSLKIETPFERRGGLTRARFGLLRRLYSAEGRRMLMTDLGQEMNVSPAGVSKLVDGLEADACVRRVGSAEDKRRVWVELLPKGCELVEHMSPNVGRHVAKLWAGLTEAEKKVLIHLLAKLRFGILSDLAHQQVEAISRHPMLMPNLD